MKRAGVLVLALFSLILLFSGCETTKGVAIGIGATTVGAAKDTQNTYNFLVKTDDWMRKNLW